MTTQLNTQATEYAEAQFEHEKIKIPSMRDFGEGVRAYSKFCKAIHEHAVARKAVETMYTLGLQQHGTEWHTAVDEARWEIGRREFGFNQ